MSSEIIKSTIEDCMDAIIDYRGKTPKKSNSGIPLITAKIVKNGSILQPTEFIPEEDYDHWMVRGLPDVGDIVLTTEAPLGEVAQLQEKKVALAQRIVTLRGKKGVLDNNYLVYLLQSANVQNQLHSRATGTTVKGIKQSELRKVILSIPSLKYQKWVARILLSLDRKIKKNELINQTLEQMAQALFKSWFVDFEPVKAKIALLAAGGSQQEATLAAMTAISGKDADSLAVFEREQPEKFAGLKATAELFPSAMQQSELGGIPMGWTNSEIGEEIDIAGGATPSTKEPKFWENGNINWTTPKDLSNLQDKILIKTDRKITGRGLAKISSGLLAIDTVLMSSRAPVGYLALAKIPVAINQGYIAMKCNYDLSPEFVLQWCNHNMPEIISRASGTTFAEISKKNFNPIPLIKPLKNLVDIYTREVRSLYLFIEKNVRQTEMLQQLRDTLLPKLLSGEITLPQAEQTLNESENSWL